MRSGTLQAAMHSLKDVPGNEETPGLVIAAMLERRRQRFPRAASGLSLETFRASRARGS